MVKMLKDGGSKISNHSFLSSLLLFFTILVSTIFVTTAFSPEAESNSGPSDIRTKDLVVQGDEELLLSNEKLRIAGYIIVKDNARLVVKNSTVDMVLQYKDQYRIYLEGSASILVENSQITTTQPTNESVLALSDNSSGKILNSSVEIDVGTHENAEVFIENSSIFSEVLWVDTAELTAIGSSLPSTVTFSFTGKTPENLRIDGLKFKEKEEDFSFRSTEGGKLRVKDTFVGRWTIYFYYPHTMKHVNLKNSENVFIWMTFPQGSNLRIENLRRYSYYSQFKLSNRIEGKGLNYDLTIENSSISFWKLIMEGGTKGSSYLLRNIAGQVSPNNRANVLVENSRATGFFIRGGGTRVKFINSEVNGNFVLIPVVEIKEGLEPDTKIIFENTYIGGVQRVQVAVGTARFEGNVSISFPLESIIWTSGVIEREFPVLVKDENGRIVSDALVNLFNFEGRKVETKLSGENGRTSFVVPFNENNFRKSRRLEAQYENWTISKEIDFTTDTPVVLSPSREKEKAGEKISYAEHLIIWENNIELKSNLENVLKKLEEAKEAYRNKNFLKSYRIANKIISSIGIQIDGGPEDWRWIPPLVSDPREAAMDNRYDIRSFYGIRDRKYLYIMLEMYGKPDSKSIAIDFDLDGEKRYGDYIIHGADKTLAESPPFGEFREIYAVKRFSEEVLEVKIPLKYFDYAEDIEICNLFTFFGSEESRIDSVKGRIKFPTPPNLSITSLELQPEGGEGENNVNFSATLVNKGGMDWSFSVGLFLDNNFVENENITLKSGERKTISFSVKGLEAGTHKAKIIGLARTFTGEISSLEKNFDVLELAKFKVTEFSINKSIVKLGENVTISVKVSNTGGKEGTYTVELSFGGETKTKDVTLNPDQSKEVLFEISKEKAGTYSISVGGLTEKVEVKSAEEGGLPLAWIGLGIGVIFALIVAIAVSRKF